jgi:hypothetical protein
MSFFTDAAAIIFKEPFTQKVGKLEIDIVSQTGITESTTLTNNPIEGGFNTDNATDEPTKITITGIISSFSLKNSKLKQISSLAKGKIPNRLKDAHDELYRLKKEKEPVTLVMKYKSYPNMFMSLLDMPKEAGDGETFRFTVTFQEINIVESQLVSIDNSRIKKDSAKKQSSFGRQVGGTKTPAPPLKPITLGQFIKSLF